MKKILFIISLFSILFLYGCSENKETEDIKVGIVGNSSPIDRATVSKMLSLANFSKNEIDALDTIINFKDVNEEDWFKKYVNCAYIKGDISGIDNENFAPYQNLTITQTQYLIDKYDKTKKIKIDNSNKDKPISYALWCDIYYKLMKDKNIETKELVILADNSTNSKLKKDFAITDKGLFLFEGIDTKKYINKKIKVLVKDNNIIAITEVLELEPTIKRAYITNTSNENIEVFIGGANVKFKVAKDINTKQTGKIADIKIKNNEIIAIDYYEQNLRGNINRIDDNIIRINNTNYVLDDNFTVYKIVDNNIEYSSPSELIIGEDMANFFTKGNENKIYACIIDTPPTYQNIRIALTNGNSHLFDKINLEAKDGLNILVKGQNKELKSLDIEKNKDFNIGENEIILIEPKNKDDKIIIKNLKRGYVNPEFFGKIEICKKDNKYLIINSVDIDTYIASLLASSKLVTEKESLKALSIVYRNIAIQNINKNNLANIGANVDDSSKYGLYNNFPMQDIYINCAKETSNKVLKYNDELISPSYFNYSSGASANSKEVWYSKSFTFPSEDKPYLAHTKDFGQNIYDDLSDDINANIFYKTKDIDCSEKNSPWFRWTTTLEQSSIDKISKNINNLYKEEKFFLKTLQNGSYIYKPIEDIGKIKDINVKERGAGGNIMKLEIIGDKETVLAIGDSTIKKIFSIENVINNHNQIVQDFKYLPSNFYVFDKIYDNNGYLKKLTFYGGGFGHGVGLSLNGANELAKNGASFEEILNKYYLDIKIENLQ